MRAAPPSPNRPQKIGLRITINPTTQNPEFKHTHPLPTAEQAVHYLSEKQRRELNNIISISRFSRLQDAITCCRNANATIKLRDWTRAIIAATANNLNDSAAEIEMIAHSGPAYLAIGNTVFHLTATDMLHAGPRALPALRQRVIDDAKTEKDAILSQAKLDAQKIINAAHTESNRINRTLTTAREEIERLRAEASSSPVIPEWVRAAGLPVRYKSFINYETERNEFRMEIGFTLPITITSFIYSWEALDSSGTNVMKQRTWLALRSSKPLHFAAWLPINIDGSYNARQIHLSQDLGDGRFGVLPHINYGSGCMVFGDAPPTITTLDHMNALIACASRVHSVVNLSSPLGNTLPWHPRVKRLTPRPLWAIIGGHTGYWHPHLLALPCDDEVIVPPAITVHLDDEPTAEPVIEAPEEL